MLYNLKVHKGNYPMTNNTDELLSFELYSEDELKELQQQSEDQDFTDSIPTFSELNPSLSWPAQSYPAKILLSSENGDPI